MGNSKNLYPELFDKIVADHEEQQFEKINNQLKELEYKIFKELGSQYSGLHSSPIKF